MTRGDREPPKPPEGLTVATPNEWLPIWDRVIVTTPAKAVGYACATRFAGWEDGAEIRPGNPILARICGCSTRTVERAFEQIRGYGLMWRYHKGVRQGDADIYRLTIPDDAFVRIPLLGPKWTTADTQSAPDRESAPDTVSGANGASRASRPVDKPPLTADTQSAPDRESLTADPVSGPLATESRPTSVGDPSNDLSTLANTSPATAGVEGVGSGEGKPENRSGATTKVITGQVIGRPALATCRGCGGRDEPGQIEASGGYCIWCDIRPPSQQAGVSRRSS